MKMDSSSLLPRMLDPASTESEELAEGLVCWEIPEQTYAVCSCTSPRLAEAFQKLLNEWLPQTNFERAPGPEFDLLDAWHLVARYCEIHWAS